MGKDLELPEPTDDCQTTASWAERLALAKTTLTDIAKIGYQANVARQIRSAILKLPDLAEQATSGTLDHLCYPVVRTQDKKEADKVFRGFSGRDLASKPFEINREDISYMVDPRTTDVLLAEVISDTHIFGLSAVRSLEQYFSRKRGVYYQYFAVRLTPRKFKPRYPTQLPIDTSP